MTGTGCHLLLISGSLRSGSTNTTVVHTAASLTPPGISATVYDEMGDLPHFNPDDDTEPLPLTVARLRAALRAADALLVSIPEYAGALPGSFKNLLEWTVGSTDLSDKPVAWINASSSPTGARDAHDSLRTILGYVDADIVEAACVHIPVPRDAIGPDGTIQEPAIRAQIAEVMSTLGTRATAGESHRLEPEVTQ